MDIHEKQKVDHLYNIHNSQKSTHTRIKYMLSQICNRQTSTKRLVDVGVFCTQMRQKDSIICNWARVVYKLTIPSIESLQHIVNDLVSQHKQYDKLKIHFRVSMALTLKALQIRGVSVDIINRTRQKLKFSIEHSVTPLHSQDHCYVHKKRPSMLIMSPIRSW